MAREGVAILEGDVMTLVEKLRRSCTQWRCIDRDAMCQEAADRIEELEAECSMFAAGACIYPNGEGLVGDEHGNSYCLVEQERVRLDTRETELLARINELEAALAWYADQMCEGLCMDKDPKFCANIGADNCSGCPAVVALKNPIDTPRG